MRVLALLVNGGGVALLMAGCAAQHSAPQEQATADQAEQQTCPRPDDTPLPVVRFRKPQPAPYSQAERTCWADWSQARAVVQGSHGLWVDVRDAGSARHLSLYGVTRVALTDLDDKAFLKDQALVLVGTGVDLKALTDRCVALRQSSQYKSVHVLIGGVRAWREAGQAIQLDGSVLPASQVDAQELWLGASDGQWQIAALGLTQEQRQRLPVPQAQMLDLGADVTQAIAELTRLVNQPLPAPSRWLVVAADPTQLAQAQALWRQRQVPESPSSPNAPMWLFGGWPAYVGYLQQQQTFAANAGRSLPRLCGL